MKMESFLRHYLVVIHAFAFFFVYNTNKECTVIKFRYKNKDHEFWKYIWLYDELLKRIKIWRLGTTPVNNYFLAEKKMWELKKNLWYIPEFNSVQNSCYRRELRTVWHFENKEKRTPTMTKTIYIWSKKSNNPKWNYVC